jgi:hypothetical protein
VHAAAIRLLGVMQVVWGVAEEQTDVTQWMIEYELKELMIQCSRMRREAFDVHSRRKDQAFQWRDADSEALVRANENNYPWWEIISQGHCKHFEVPHIEIFDKKFQIKAVIEFAKQLEKEVSRLVDWRLVLIGFWCGRRCGICWRGAEHPMLMSTLRQQQVL